MKDDPDFSDICVYLIEKWIYEPRRELDRLKRVIPITAYHRKEIKKAKIKLTNEILDRIHLREKWQRCKTEEEKNILREEFKKFSRYDM